MTTPLRLALLLAAALTAARPQPRTVPPHEDAVDGILRVLDSVPLVAILEEHQLAEEGELYVRLLRDPRAPGRIDDVILELGNQLFQPLADRYVGWAAGPPVPADSAFMILHDNTQAGLVTMYAPMYQATLDTVRDANAKVPRARRMRVLLGDPPVDWRTLTREALWEAHKRRGELMRELARDSVVARGRRGVLIAGGSHLIRRPRSGGPGARGDATWGALADRIFVVEVHTGFGAPLAHLEPALDSLPRFAMLRTADPLLRDLLYDDVKAATAASGARPATPAAPPAGMRSANAGVPLRELADAYVYLGPFRSLGRSAADVSPLRAPARLAELQRRTCMVLGRGADTTRLFRAPASPLYFPSGERPSRVDYEPASAAPRDERAGPPPLPSPLPEPCATLLAPAPR
jgi:hypothetical protein